MEDRNTVISVVNVRSIETTAFKSYLATYDQIDGPIYKYFITSVLTALSSPSAVASLRRVFADLPKMPFKRYVEIGRVALVNYGKDYGKLVVIVDVIDQNRALVDAPDMVRSQMNFKRLSLTDIKIEINRVPKKKALIEAMEKADVKNKWENSSWGRRLTVQKRRASLNDFDRFKLMLAKIKKAGIVRQELARLKKEAA
ncbi:60S ribosomal protein L14-2 [Populus alba x Populus x berolinensis]|nr:60S ribosomal protein L14-2 [Populus alba x Populus x berolinensis]